MECNEGSIPQAKAALQRIESFVRSIEPDRDDPENEAEVKEFRRVFYGHLDADFDTPKALGGLFEFIHRQNRLGTRHHRFRGFGVSDRASMANKRSCVSLAELASGAQAVVREVGGGKVFASRLAGMGLIVGSRLEVLQNLHHGPVLIRVRDTRIALGRGEAMRVLAEEVAG